MKFQGFIGSSDTSQNPIADNEITMNWYLEPLSANAKSQAQLLPTPGFQTWATVSAIGTRAALEINGRTFFVVGTTLYEALSIATMTVRGTVTQDSNPATITSNGAAGGQLFITSGSNGYCYTLATNVLTQVLTGDATMGGQLDGYFIAFNVTTGRIRLSNLNDGTTWDPTQFAAGSASDNWVSMVVVEQPAGVWLIGSKSGVVWYDAGTFPFPFAPIPGATFRYGTVGSFAVSVAGDRVTWLSQNQDGAGIVVMARGYTPQPISTSAVEVEISDYARTSRISDAEVSSHQMEGHIFTVFTFPSAVGTATRSGTLVYDQTTNQWHSRGYWNPAMTRFDIWRPRVHVYSFGLHLIGDRTTGKISVMDNTFGLEADGSAIRRLRRAPGVFSEHRQVLLRRFEVYLQAGIGTLTGQGSAPVMFMRTSDDGGVTWLPERQSSAGVMGKYSTRVFWTRLGVPRDRVFEVSVSDPIPWRIVDAFLNNDSVSQGRAA